MQKGYRMSADAVARKVASRSKTTRHGIQHYFAEWCEASKFRIATSPTDTGGMFISRNNISGNYEIRRIINNKGTSKLVLEFNGDRPIFVANSLKAAAELAIRSKLN